MASHSFTTRIIIDDKDMDGLIKLEGSLDLVTCSIPKTEGPLRQIIRKVIMAAKASESEEG